MVETNLLAKTDIRGLALESGGSAALSHVGVIEVLVKKGIMDDITHLIGSSAGSIAAVLCACKISISEIKEAMLAMDLQKLKDGSWFLPKNLWRLYKEYGWYKGIALREWLEKLMEKHAGKKDITFGELYEKTEIFVTVTSTDIGWRVTRYYNHIKTPKMKIADALRESCSIPIFYCPVKKDKNIYVDGGMLNSYPIRYLYKYMKPENVIGSKLMSDEEIKQKKRKTMLVMNNFEEYATEMISILLDIARSRHIKKEDWKRTIVVDTGNITATDFNLTQKQKARLINAGVIAAEKFFKDKL